MKSRSTLIWFLSAVALFIFILVFERPWHNKRAAEALPQKLLSDFAPQTVTEIRVARRSGIVRVQRTNDSWWIVSPINYPAQPVVIDNLLNEINEIKCTKRIESSRLSEFGLDDPETSIFLLYGSTKTELQLGKKTPFGDEIYVRLTGGDAIYTASSRLLEFIPESLNDWRSLALIFSQTNTPFDRFEVKSQMRGIGFSLQYNPTNRVWRLVSPLQARAERVKIDQLLLKVLSSRISKFVSDNPSVDLEKYGLANPELELILGTGTNDIVKVQFGKPQQENNAYVYARLSIHSNIVLVAKDLVDALRVPFNELRERRLITFQPGTVSTIEFRGAESFTLQQQTNLTWRIIEPQELPADLSLISNLLSDLLSIEVVEFEKDIVTDYTPYGLAKPLRQVILKSLITNAGIPTHIVIAQLDFGTNGAGKYYARRWDEPSVYEIRESDFLKLPSAGWELRDRQIWNLNLTNLSRITVSKGGITAQFIKRPDGEWTFAPGSYGMMNKSGFVRTLGRLCALQAVSWKARGQENRQKFGFTDDCHKINIEVKTESGETRNYILELGAQTESLTLYGAVTLEGQLWIFELPWVVADDIIRNLTPMSQDINK